MTAGIEGDAAVVGFAAQRQYFAIYVMCTDEHGHIAGQYRKELPKANIGKSCIRFKNVEDFPTAVLVKLLKHVERLGLPKQCAWR